jgi:Protein of unknown function (DUF1266)
MSSMYCAVGLVLVVTVIGLLRLRQVPAAVKQMKEEDGDDPLKRWARGCYLVVYDRSPERFGASDCQRGLASSWSIRSGEEALATIDRLSAVPTGRVAWDLVRTVMVTRLAAAAGFISPGQAQAAVGNIQRRLQEQYPGWEEVAADYDKVVREKGFSEGHLQGRPTAREIWKVVPFK